jgi:hypothetical protein
MKKIAFLFLILDNPNFPKIWNSYFRGYLNQYSIYIHPKYPDKLVWKKKSLINNLKETAWGFITRAYIELLKEAYKDPDNYKFVTISESCIPITSFDKFYKDCISDPRSWIKSMELKKYDYEGRLNLEKTKPKPQHFIKSYARFCLNRDHVKELLSKERELEFFHRMQVGDEYFLSVLYPLKNSRDFAVTYDDWDYIHKIKKNIKNKIRLLWEKQEKEKIDTSKERQKLQQEFNEIAKSPKTITIVTKEDLENIKNCKSYFYRKFSKKSDIEKYWKDIIKNNE